VGEKSSHKPKETEKRYAKSFSKRKRNCQPEWTVYMRFLEQQKHRDGEKAEVGGVEMVK
jgi:hypothetical protein